MHHDSCRYLFLVASLGVGGCGFELDFDVCDDNPCEDGNICTRDTCTPVFLWDRECTHSPINQGETCGSKDGVTLTCRGVYCGAESLCDGVTCVDSNLCTKDACVWDGTCLFEPIACNDGNQCTTGECNPDTGDCEFAPSDGAGGFFGGLCNVEMASSESREVPFGLCEEGECVLPCDPSAEEVSPCPLLDGEYALCCPGREHCTVGVGGSKPSMSDCY